MNMGRALTLIFNDPAWVSKLLITALITLLSFMLTPALIGLAGWAVLMGYQAALIANMRAGVPHPLPRWDDISEYFSVGGQLLIAQAVYVLPLLLLGGFAGLISLVFGGDPTITSALGLVALCCLLPLTLAYSLVWMPMYAVGVGRFLDDPRLGVFFRFSHLFATLRPHTPLIVNFLLQSLLLNLLLGVLAAIPCLGWIALAALAVPLNGMVVGLFLMRILSVSKRKPS